MPPPPTPQSAVKLSSGVLQKYPDDPLVKTLRAIALEKTGKQDEANKVACTAEGWHSWKLGFYVFVKCIIIIIIIEGLSLLQCIRDHN